MLTRMNLSAVRDLTSIKTIAQQAIQGSAREGCAPGAATLSAHPNLAPKAFLIQASLELRNTAQG
jgi:hypothetical protein